MPQFKSYDIIDYTYYDSNLKEKHISIIGIFEKGDFFFREENGNEIDEKIEKILLDTAEEKLRYWLATPDRINAYVDEVRRKVALLFRKRRRFRQAQCASWTLRGCTMFYKPFLAGLLIALGGYANMKMGGIPGGVLFSLGLLTVIHFRLPLFTGMVAFLENYDEVEKVKNLFMVLGLNFIGAATAGCFTFLRGIDAKIDIGSKLMKTPPEFFFDAVLCGTCVAIAAKSRNQLMTVLAVALFVLCGGEHCIADMFYFFADGLFMESNAYAMVCIIALFIGVLGNMGGGLLMSKIEKGAESEKNN